MSKKWNTRKHKRDFNNAHEHVDSLELDDEIDAFHKQRDFVSLDVNEDSPKTSEDDEEPIFDNENVTEFGDTDDDIDGGNDDDDDDVDVGFTSKIARQQKFLREKFGCIENEIMDEEVQEDEEKKYVWGGKKHLYYHDGDIRSDNDEAFDEEEAEALRLHNEKLKSLSIEDFDLDDITKLGSEKELELKDLSYSACEAFDVKNERNRVSVNEQRDIINSHAPELVGMLSELKDAVVQLEDKVEPLLAKFKRSHMQKKAGMRYLETKHLVLLSYCQAITFYLMLKSEGLPVRDHPVIAHLVNIKALLDKVKHMDESFMLKDFYAKDIEVEKAQSLHEEVHDFTKASLGNHQHDSSNTDSGNQDINDRNCISKEHAGEVPQNVKVSKQSLEMLKLRASLGERLNRKGLVSFPSYERDKDQKKQGKPQNEKLEGYGDLNDDDDDTFRAVRSAHGSGDRAANTLISSKVFQVLSSGQNKRKEKFVSGDDDLPLRDDIGERRRKHEMRVLSRAGIETEGAGVAEKTEVSVHGGSGSDNTDSINGHDVEDEHGSGTKVEADRGIKQKRATKLGHKLDSETRNPVMSLPDIVEGKRKISYEIEKNRGLTRPRKKLTKNPRKKYQLKHEKAMKRRKGQVRDIKKPLTLYGGEASGINPGISRSVRF